MHYKTQLNPLANVRLYTLVRKTPDLREPCLGDNKSNTFTLKLHFKKRGFFFPHQAQKEKEKKRNVLPTNRRLKA